MAPVNEETWAWIVQVHRPTSGLIVVVAAVELGGIGEPDAVVDVVDLTAVVQELENLIAVAGDERVVGLFECSAGGIRFGSVRGMCSLMRFTGRSLAPIRSSRFSGLAAFPIESGEWLLTG